mgnify:CR=1 FL=1
MINKIMTGKVIIKTNQRYFHLKYANGDLDFCPSYSVMRGLQKLGMVVWNGWVKGQSAAQKLSEKRGWQITEKGKKFLESWS